ncbi:unnamed protein product [Acanthoscelides obtectus]|uniref:C2H2-type domain-containing protein n=1 Tax=Acanthoscelides obtectus TaxID=200917 RepID=A0A9P0PZK1_ACAOB|nr:unnamed protein product [Acanthoscelides obtectus]CAK1682191.1 Zinc finger Y-chromosomal protein [Acanthoscelides obtectus]
MECDMNSKTFLKVEVDEREESEMETEKHPIIHDKGDKYMDVAPTTVFESVKNEENDWDVCGVGNLSAPELKLEINDSILRRVGGEFEENILTHPENPSKHRYTITCIHCNATFDSKVTVDDHVAKIHPEFTTSNSNNIYECTTCVYITTEKDNFDRHTKLHLETVSNDNFKRCVHCDTTFKGTSSMNEHIVRKHPEFIASVTVKVYECTVCTYKTTKKPNFYRHMSVHPEIDISNTLQKCNHCDAKFKNKFLVDEHIIKAHPEFIMYSKIYECTSCSYKTTINSCYKKHILTHLTYKCTACTYKTNVKTALDSHMLQHPQISNHKDVKCVHCGAAFKRKVSLDDHIIRLHPEFIESVTSKLHTCTNCSYKTVLRNVFEKHVLEHGGNNTSSQPNSCHHCNVSFKNGISLDDHILKKHEEFISAVNRKIHKCEQCAYKTVLKTLYNEHMLKSHPESLGSLSMQVYECLRCSYKTFKRNSFDYHCISSHPQTDSSSKKCHACVHCNKTFRSKRALENHVLKIHPDFISFVTKQCTKCAFKSVSKYNLEKHMLTHHETISSSKPVLSSDVCK